MRNMVAQPSIAPQLLPITSGVGSYLSSSYLTALSLLQRYWSETMPEVTDQSLHLVAESLREEPHSRSEGHGRVRTSIAVIRAYAKNFCNIPPFCSGRSHE